jgi:PAS domain S-box-containing protein
VIIHERQGMIFARWEPIARGCRDADGGNTELSEPRGRTDRASAGQGLVPATGPDPVLGRGDRCPLRQAAGTLVGFGVIVHDLTPHGLTEECAAILDSVPDAVIGINASGRIVSANQAAGTIFGYGRAELAGLDVQLLVPAELRVHLRSLLDREVPAGGGDADPRPHRRRRNLTGLRSDGGWFSAEVSLASVVTAQGLVTIAVVRDVSGDRPTTAAPEADATAPRGATV